MLLDSLLTAALFIVIIAVILIAYALGIYSIPVAHALKMSKSKLSPLHHVVGTIMIGLWLFVILCFSINIISSLIVGLIIYEVINFLYLNKYNEILDDMYKDLKNKIKEKFKMIINKIKFIYFKIKYRKNYYYAEVM